MKIAVLGCGNMGRALISGIKDSYPEAEIRVSDPSPDALQKVASITTEEQPEDWFTAQSAPDAVLLAVKPQYINDACRVFTRTSPGTLWISVAAGVSILHLQGILPQGAKVCRVMPNTPALIGEGMSAYALDANCGVEEKSLAEKILACTGSYIFVSESVMGAVTGLSGSGPAYVYTVIEALAEGGVAMGLSYGEALKCAAATVRGAASMVEKTGEHPAVLKSHVLSAGGATAAAVKTLEERGLRAALIHAVQASCERSKELG
ncbi:MAG: pyrroline-5-carboxylate reductase [Fibrobacterota bacterium]